MSLQGFYLLPHPPVIMPEIGKGEESKISKTSSAMHTIGKEIAQAAPDAIILITPHGTMFQDAIALAFEEQLSGSMKNFGAPFITMNASIDKALTKKIYEAASKSGISAILATHALLKQYKASLELDHGSMVPLYFINGYYKDYKLVHITYAPLSDIDLYRFGMEIDKVLALSDTKAVIIASGDLSHRLKEDGPYDFSPYGLKFDNEFLHHLEKGEAVEVLSMDMETVCNAGECGRRSTAILLGALDSKSFNGTLISYEGTFGVGYGVMKFEVISENESKLEQLEALRANARKRKQTQSDPYVRLARESLTHFLTSGKDLINLPEYVTHEMRSNRRGVFVSLKKHGELRGCIGTIFPATDSIADEIIRNAVEAGLNDPRFSEVQADELVDIDFSVDVLTEPQPCSKEELDPARYGVIVRAKSKTGLLLPDLEGIDIVEEQLEIALKKAGIRPGEAYQIQKFEVIRHKES